MAVFGRRISKFRGELKVAVCVRLVFFFCNSKKQKAEMPYKALVNCCSHSVLRWICPETLFENGTGLALKQLTRCCWPCGNPKSLGPDCDVFAFWKILVAKHWFLSSQNPEIFYLGKLASGSVPSASPSTELFFARWRR